MINCAYCKTIKEFRNTTEEAFLEEIKSGIEEAKIDIRIENEKNAWKNNRDALAEVLLKDINGDAYIAFEVLCPNGSQRIDCMLFGKDKNNKKHIALIEMKQWSNGSVELVENLGFFQENQVRAQVGRNSFKYHAHPSDQANGYRQALLSCMPIFENEDDIELHGYAYCYNYMSDGNNPVLFDKQYQDVMDICNLFGYREDKIFSEKLSPLFEGGSGQEVYNEYINSEIRPTRFLMDAVAGMFSDDEDDSQDNTTKLILQNEQRPAAKKIFDLVEEAKKDPEKKNKYVFIVKGGPGTGKTMIALHVLSQLAKKYSQKEINIKYATRSTALKTTLKDRLKRITTNGVGAAKLICDSIFNIYPKIDGVKDGFSESEIDVLIVDEAHRIEKSANNQGTGTNTYLSQINSLLYCARISVFFIDDHQYVNSTEIGQSSFIEAAAINYRNGFDSDKEYFYTHKNKQGQERGYSIECEKLRKAQKDIKELHDQIKEIMMRSDMSLYEKKEMSEKLSSKIKDITYEKENGEFKKRKDGTFIDKIEKAKRKVERMKLVCESTVTPKTEKVECNKFSLTTQFRCNGSGNYIEWLDSILFPDDPDIPHDVSLDESYDFGVFDTPQELEKKIRSLDKPYLDPGAKKPDWIKDVAGSKSEEIVARMVAGYYWEWHERKKGEDDLPHDVRIDEFDWEMPWETKGTQAKGKYENMYAPSAEVWATHPSGINQLGCVPSAQGFEFDYVGVILAPDIKYDSQSGKIETVLGHTHDATTDEQIRNVYRVLMSRGRKGCYVFCCNKELNEYFKKLVQERNK